MATTRTNLRIPRTARKNRAAQRKNVVVIGGGTGSYNALSGLKKFACDLTAVVAMTDSGGSSGRLRDEFGHLPPGDLRQCLLALSPDDHASLLLRQLFNYRFDKGTGLDGHSFGNLFLTALTEVTGSTETAVLEMGRLLGIRGKVLPVTLTNSNVVARLQNGKTVVGEANLDRREIDPDVPIDYVYLEPKAFVYPLTAQAILDADAIVIGPGDLYTSIVPNLLVDGVCEAIQRSRGTRIYVCNIMTKRGESSGFKASDFIREVQTYLGSRSIPEYVLVNTELIPERVLQRYQTEGAEAVEYDEAACRKLVPNVIAKPLLAVGTFVRHDARRLAETVFEIV
ncbi:MAG: YvcK family protein [Chloroflexi bacterium]|nr:YvcK family protein [Chloroflexota bacterium]